MDKLQLAEQLYLKFWARNKDPNPIPFASQAIAIRNMWINIAQDALVLTKCQDFVEEVKAER